MFIRSRLPILLVAAAISLLGAARRPPNDYDGDGRTDLVVWRPTEGNWYFVASSGHCPNVPWVRQYPGVPDGCIVQWGLNGDTVLHGDYDGDGKSDFVIYRPYLFSFYFHWSSFNGSASYQFGNQPGDIPVAGGDFSGDGRADVAWVRIFPGPPTGQSRKNWYIRDSSTGQIAIWQTAPFFSQGRFYPLANFDWDGDGRADVAEFTTFPNSVLNLWFRYRTPDPNSYQEIEWPSDRGSYLPVAGDYNGDGRSDFAAVSTDTFEWKILYNFFPASVAAPVVQWGLPGDIPVSGDFDGDGKSDIAVWRPSIGTWFVIPSSGRCPAGMAPHLAGCYRQWGLPQDQAPGAIATSANTPTPL